MADSRINKEWHEANRMPKNPTRQQRLDWHIEHSRSCSCRTPSARLQAEMDAWLAERERAAPH
jgi:hypothetical protein